MNHKSTFRTIDGVTEKLCGGCQTFKPHDHEHFHRNKQKASGFNSHCKACQREQCNRLMSERYAMRTKQGAAQLLTGLWRAGNRKKIA